MISIEFKAHGSTKHTHIEKSVLKHPFSPRVGTKVWFGAWYVSSKLISHLIQQRTL